MRESVAVVAQQLCHQYPSRAGDAGRLALDGISFEVAAGEIFGLVGPNGGGKSTSFKILSTLLRPTSGGVQILGHDALADPLLARAKLGVVFQSPALDNQLTVRENLIHQGHLHGLRGPDLETRVQRELLRFGVLDRARLQVETLSGGLKRRVELAKAVLHRPAILILDEPTTGLDPLARRALWSYLSALRLEEGVTILLTTHYLEEAEWCDRVGLIDLGKMVALGKPDDLKKEVARDIVRIQAGNLNGLKAELEKKLDGELLVRSSIVEGELRLECRNGLAVLLRVTEEKIRDKISAITLGRPSLEDFFIMKTGRRFVEQDASPEPVRERRGRKRA